MKMEKNSRQCIRRGGGYPSSNGKKKSRSTMGSNVKRRWGPEPPLLRGGRGTKVWSSKERELVTTNQRAVLLSLQNLMRGFNYPLTVSLSSLFILFGLSSNSTASLVSRSV